MTAVHARLRAQAGFTLTELLIACAIIGVVMAGLFSILSSGQQTYLVGSNTVEAQQELRLVIQRMTNEVRHAGFCPTCGTGSPAVTPFSALTGVSATGFTIQNDWDGTWDGAAGITTGATVNYVVVGTDGVAVTTPRGEQIVYAFSAGQLTRREVGLDGAGVVLASNLASRC
jgi:prepilin-type N-terminal cleavage/methylation domain-containing protein